MGWKCLPIDRLKVVPHKIVPVPLPVTDQIYDDPFKVSFFLNNVGHGHGHVHELAM